jgi:hypothetical protein
VTSSKQIAGILGPTLVALGASEALNARVFKDNTAPLIYLNGTVLFVSGLAIVRAHNRWTRGWPIVVTLAGWVLILVGLFRMFAPEPQRSVSKNEPTIIASASLAGLAGLFLTFKAYGREGSEGIAG